MKVHCIEFRAMNFRFRTGDGQKNFQARLFHLIGEPAACDEVLNIRESSVMMLMFRHMHLEAQPPDPPAALSGGANVIARQRKRFQPVGHMIQARAEIQEGSHVHIATDAPATVIVKYFQKFAPLLCPPLTAIGLNTEVPGFASHFRGETRTT